jgi:tRNA (guanine-N7-)-methyltransferase
MGRRALPKINSAVDLSRHLYELEQMQAPFQPNIFFARPGRLHVEIGSGKGLFMRSAATTNPEDLFVGVEMAFKYARYAAFKLASAEIGNAIMIAGDGLRFMAEFIADSSLDSVHVYFPDPWWKARHKKRRVMRESLCRDIQRTLKSGGELHFWTDVEEYYLTSLELIAGCTTLQGPLAVDERPPAHDLDYRTHFERRTRQHELPVYRSRFVN